MYRYHFYCPFIMSERYTDLRAPHSFDFIGLNYYVSTSVFIGFLSCNPEVVILKDFSQCLVVFGIISLKICAACYCQISWCVIELCSFYFFSSRAIPLALLGYMLVISTCTVRMLLFDGSPFFPCYFAIVELQYAVEWTT